MLISKKKNIALLLLFVMGVSMIVMPFVNTNADVLGGTIAINRDEDYKTKVRFKLNHVDGQTTPYEAEYVGWTSYMNGGKRVVYSLENPKLEPQSLKGMAFPKHLPEKQLRALMAIAESNTPQGASSAAGLASQDTLDRNHYHAAIQLATWKVVAQNSKEYYIEDLNIQPAGVKTVADWLVQRSAKAVAGEPNREDIETSIIPKPTLEVDKSKRYVDNTTSKDLTYVGPFRVNSNKSRSLAHTMSDSRAQMFSAVGGLKLDKVETNQDFYLAFDKDTSYQGFKMDFSMSDERFDVGVFGHDAQKVITSAWTPYKLSTSLVVGDVNSYGRIRVVKYLDEAKTPIKDAKFEIKDSKGNMVQTLVTGADGVAFSNDLPTGKYFVKETNNGQAHNVDPKVFEVEVTKSGEVQEVISYSSTKSGNLSITVKDLDSQKAVGYSKLQIIRKSDKALVREITLDETGVAKGLTIPTGEYLVKEVSTPTAYELNTVMKEFTITDQDQAVELVFEKKVKNSSVKFDAKRDKDKVGIIGLNLDVYEAGSGEWLTTLITGADGTVQLGLPKGTFYAKMKPLQGYAIDTNEQFPFVIEGKGETQPVNITLGQSKGQFIVTTRSNQGTLVENVHVDVINQEGKVIKTQYSDKDGKIVFSDLPAGQTLNYKVTAVPFGFKLDSSLVPFKLNTNGENFYAQITVMISGTGPNPVPPTNPNPPTKPEENVDLGKVEDVEIGGNRDRDKWNDRDNDRDIDRDDDTININGNDDTININDGEDLISINDGDDVIDINQGEGLDNIIAWNNGANDDTITITGTDGDVHYVDAPLNTDLIGSDGTITIADGNGGPIGDAETWGKGGGTVLPQTGDFSGIQYLGLGLTGLSGVLGALNFKKKEDEEDK